MHRGEIYRLRRWFANSSSGEQAPRPPSCECEVDSATPNRISSSSIIMMHTCASQLWSPIRRGSMSLLIESTSHSQLGGRGACSPDAELANHRRRRYISPRCILYIFDFLWCTSVHHNYGAPFDAAQWACSLNPLRIRVANPRRRRDISPRCILYIFDSAVFLTAQTLYHTFLKIARLFWKKHQKSW